MKDGQQFQAGIGQGVGSALQQLSRYYIQLADKMFPIIEVDAGQPVDIVITKGIAVAYASKEIPEMHEGRVEKNGSTQTLKGPVMKTTRRSLPPLVRLFAGSAFAAGDASSTVTGQPEAKYPSTVIKSVTAARHCRGIYEWSWARRRLCRDPAFNLVWSSLRCTEPGRSDEQDHGGQVAKMSFKSLP